MTLEESALERGSAASAAEEGKRRLRVEFQAASSKSFSNESLAVLRKQAVELVQEGTITQAEADQQFRELALSSIAKSLQKTSDVSQIEALTERNFVTLAEIRESELIRNAVVSNLLSAIDRGGLSFGALGQIFTTGGRPHANPDYVLISKEEIAANPKLRQGVAQRLEALMQNNSLHDFDDDSKLYLVWGLISQSEVDNIYERYKPAQT